MCVFALLFYYCFPPSFILLVCGLFSKGSVIVLHVEVSSFNRAIFMVIFGVSDNSFFGFFDS